jgi:uncharacterized protein YjbI with pentapeptide repeats
MPQGAGAERPRGGSVLGCPMAQRASLPHMDPPVEAALIAVAGTVVVAVTGFWTTRSVTGITLAEQRKQLDRTLEEQRTRTLNDRFATAADQLGSDKPAAVRLAAVYAMAGLADGWEENRQTCVEVLCAYLRMPYELDPGGDKALEKQRLDFRVSREVRHSAIRVITAHLKDNAAVSWQGLNFDFTGAIFDGGSFDDANFSGGTVDFRGAVFAGGEVTFRSAKFSGANVDFILAKFCGGTVDFQYAAFSRGMVNFRNAEFSSGKVNFSGARFCGGEVYFGDAEFCGGTVDFGSAQFSRSEVGFQGARFSDGTVDFDNANFTEVGALRFNGATFGGGDVNFRWAEFTGGYIGFSHAKLEGSAVHFDHAKFTGSNVDFVGDAADARFEGGTVDFSGAADWRHPPTFPWNAGLHPSSTPPAVVKLPSKGDQPGA